MTNFDLKNKIEVNTEFINDLISRGWQEAESLKQQIDGLNVNTRTSEKVAQLLQALLTAQYVFLGGLEKLSDQPEAESSIDADELEVYEQNQMIEQDTDSTELASITPDDEAEFENTNSTPMRDASSDFELFEYFVDFDDPTGEPISDKDLYY